MVRHRTILVRPGNQARPRPGLQKAGPAAPSPHPHTSSRARPLAPKPAAFGLLTVTLLPAHVAGPHAHKHSQLSLGSQCHKQKASFCWVSLPMLSPRSKHRTQLRLGFYPSSWLADHPRGPFGREFFTQGTPCLPYPTAQSPKLFWGYNFDPIIFC